MIKPALVHAVLNASRSALDHLLDSDPPQGLSLQQCSILGARASLALAILNGEGEIEHTVKVATPRDEKRDDQ